MNLYAPKYKQLDLGLLRSSLDELDKTNRWVALGDLLPWTELEKEYNSRLYNQKKGKMMRETIGGMLNYLHKDIRILMDLLAKNKAYYESLFLYEKRTLTAILRMYHQQEEMYKSKTHTCADRILSIFQPHVRGKAKART